MKQFLINLYSRRFQFLFFCAAAFSPSAIYSQQGFYFDQLTIDKGLSQNTVNCLLQDQEGYLWFGTRDGLNRYDGYRFIVYKRNIYDSTSISGNWITDILEDKRGNIWIATMNGGLNRYDKMSGEFKRYNNFTVMTADSGNYQPLLYIKALFEDSHGMIWILTNAVGLTRFDVKHDAFTYYPRVEFGSEAGVSDFVINAVVEDVQQTVWIGTERGGLNRYNRDDDSFTHFRNEWHDPGSLRLYTINSIYADREGIIWISTEGGGLNAYHPTDNRFVNFSLEPDNPRSIGSNYVGRVCENLRSDDPLLWISAGGLSFFDKRTQSFTRIINENYPAGSLPSTNTQSGFDRQGDLWLTNRRHQLIKIDATSVVKSQKQAAAAGTKIAGFEDYPLVSTGVCGTNVNAFYEDRNGLLWIATAKNGVSVCDPQANKFPHYAISAKDDPNSSAFAVKAIQPTSGGSDDILWIGTVENGLLEYDRQSGEYQQYQKTPGDGNSLPSNYISALLEDRNKVLWVGTGNGLVRASRNRAGKLSFVTYQKDNEDDKSLSDNRVMTLFVDSDSVLWVGTMNGLNRLDPVTQSFQRYLHHRFYPAGSPANLVFSLQEDHLGYLWVGTANGLVRLNRFQEPAEYYTEHTYIGHDPQNPVESLSNPWVYAIYEDPGSGGPPCDFRQVFWIGTAGGGLNKMILPSAFAGKKTTGIEFIHYGENDGLPDNTILGILADGQNNLWLSTRRGLSRFRPEHDGESTFKNYNKDEGVQGNIFYLGSYGKSKSGELFFGGENGFNSFYPDSLKETVESPPVVLTDFKVFDKSLKIGSRPLSDLQLSYYQNFFTFEFAALSYLNAAQNRYRYQLAGFDKSWLDNKNSVSANYTNVPPGDYVFRVQAANKQGVWNKDGLAIRVTITPPFWHTWWFRTLFVLTFAGALLAMHRRRVHKLEQQKFRLEQLVKARTSQLKLQKETIQEQAQKLRTIDRVKRRLFANISHEFRTPLMLIMGPLDQLKKNEFCPKTNELLQIMQRNTNRLMRLINQLLDLARFEAGDMKLDLANGDLIKQIREIILSFAPLAERHNMSLVFETRLPHLTCAFDKDKIEKILYNLLSNAFKFTPDGGRIVVECVYKSRSLKTQMRELKKEISGHHINSSSEVSLPSGGIIEIRVRDNGVGIPSDRRPYIFDRFYQVNGDSTNGIDGLHNHDCTGMGIGLALTAELVKLHQGSIRVQSTVVDGSEFIVCLPVENILPYQGDEVKTNGHHLLEMQDIEVLSGDPDKPKSEAVNPGNQPIILLIEDNMDVQCYITQQLSAKYQVVCAMDGAEGVKVALQLVPDLVISDVMMPKRDGLEVCRLLKTDERTSHIPIILLTARASVDNKLHGLESGADDYLVKPFDPQELGVRVENLIEQRRKLRKKFRQQLVLQPTDIEVTSVDQAFLKKICGIVEARMEEPDFGADSLRNALHMSKAQYHRKIHALTDQSPSQFIRSMRLKRARQLLIKRAGNISEIAFAVGFNNLSYFSKCFREQFGKLPSELENML